MYLLKIIFFLLILYYSTPIEITIRDFNSIKTYINERLYIANTSLSNSMNDPKKHFSFYFPLKLTSITLNIKRLSLFNVTYKEFGQSSHINDTLTYNIGKPFFFEMETNYIYTYGIIPIIGTVNLDLIPKI